MGQATNLYAFENYDEAIPLVEQVIQERADYTDGYDLLSLIYKEKGDL